MVQILTAAKETCCLKICGPVSHTQNKTCMGIALSVDTITLSLGCPNPWHVNCKENTWWFRERNKNSHSRPALDLRHSEYLLLSCFVTGLIRRLYDEPFQLLLCLSHWFSHFGMHENHSRACYNADC